MHVGALSPNDYLFSLVNSSCKAKCHQHFANFSLCNIFSLTSFSRRIVLLLCGKKYQPILTLHHKRSPILLQYIKKTLVAHDAIVRRRTI